MSRPDIELGAQMKAERLVFRRKPETEVRTHGEPDHDFEAGSERANLPDEVEPGVVYRDVEVRWRTTARIGPGQPARPAGSE